MIMWVLLGLLKYQVSFLGISPFLYLSDVSKEKCVVNLPSFLPYNMGHIFFLYVVWYPSFQALLNNYCVVVYYAGIDRNMCCGTHVSNLSQVQVRRYLESSYFVVSFLKQVSVTDRLFELCSSFLQVIKLFPDTESMRGGTRLFFLAGDRVLKYLGRALDNEKSLTKMLRYVTDQVVFPL